MTSIYKCCHGKTIRPGKAWTDQTGVQHPASWHTWSAAEKAEHGITEIVQQPHPDSRLYNWSYNADGTVSSTAKALDDVNEVNDDGSPMLDEKGQQVVRLGVKSTLIAEVKAQQGMLLAQSDWAIVRKADAGIDVPANIQLWRNEIRLAASSMEDAVSQASDTGAVAALFMVYTSNADGSTTKSGLLYEWPELG
jgi:hypothetical protein